MKNVFLYFYLIIFIAFTINKNKKIINEVIEEEDEEKNNNKKKLKNENNDYNDINNGMYIDKDVKDKLLQLKEVNNILNIDNDKTI